MSTDKIAVIQQWSIETMGIWGEKLQKMRIGTNRSNRRYQKLSESFQAHIKELAGGDVERIIFLYTYYGKFIDMGVGRGTNLSAVRDNSTSRRLEGKRRGNARRAKKWYSPTLYAQTNKLAEVLVEKYMHQAMLEIDEHIARKIEIKL